MQPAFWSGYGRGAWKIFAAAGVALCVSGCSSSMSRFDLPSFNLTDNTSSEGNADSSTTSSIPVPPESVYSSGGSYRGRVDHATLPPPAYTPRPASYSPAPPPDRSRIARATYSGGIAPHGESALRDDKPVAGLHVKVGKGDTLAGLSRRYGVPVETIMGANDLSDGRLHIGQELVIPGAKAQQSAQAGVKAEQTAEAKPPAPTGETYKVEKGDTPHSIAEKLGVSEQALIARNKLRASSLHIGQVLAVPAKTAQDVAADQPTPDTSTEPQVHKVKTTTITVPGASPSGQASPGQGTSLAEDEANQANPAKAKGKPDQKAKPATGDAATSPEVTGEGSGRVATNEQLPTPDPMSGNSFRWPVKGRVISEFGAKPDGGHNDGIDLAVPQGTAVMAAENGVVAYAGNELKGYGNLVLIRHANNWVSAYAHNEEILVKRGDKVRRGQVIAKAGASGTVSQPEVHFELRKGSRPVDPTKFMSSDAASAD
jgi:murein DD-endopeptidase MepM/ murein hydrolase activator NlpD